MFIFLGEAHYYQCHHGSAIKYRRSKTEEINKCADIPRYNHEDSKYTLKVIKYKSSIVIRF